MRLSQQNRAKNGGKKGWLASWQLAPMKVSMGDWLKLISTVAWPCLTRTAHCPVFRMIPVPFEIPFRSTHQLRQTDPSSSTQATQALPTATSNSHQQRMAYKVRTDVHGMSQLMAGSWLRWHRWISKTCTPKQKKTPENSEMCVIVLLVICSSSLSHHWSSHIFPNVQEFPWAPRAATAWGTGDDATNARHMLHGILEENQVHGSVSTSGLQGLFAVGTWLLNPLR